MLTLSLKCTYCKKLILRSSKRVNENRKMGWDVFCSQKCLSLHRTTRQEFTCSREGCGKKFTRTPGESKKSVKFYCSNVCSALVNNLSRHMKIRICPACGSEFTGYKIYCSLTCIPKRESKYTEEIVLKEITDFFNKNARIPVKREMYGVYKVARKYFGTWNKAIIAAGFKPNPVMFAKKFIANDGDKCDSLAEKIIDDWLYARKIKHLRSFPYPGDKGYSVDFKVGDKWVEFFGLSGQLKRYDFLKRRKLKLAENYKLDVVRIYPKDLFPVNKLSYKFGQLK